jgi:hypothetical protein
MKFHAEVRTYVTADIVRAAEYLANRKLSHEEVVRTLERDLRGVVDNYAELGRWLARLDADLHHS